MEAERDDARAALPGSICRRLDADSGHVPRPRDVARLAQQQVAAKKQERGLNENYGREVMELHTVGVDGGYTQQDVIQMARMPHRLDDSRAAQGSANSFSTTSIHAQGKKVVMGRTFNYGGEKDGEEALKMLAARPATATFYFHGAGAALCFGQSAAGAGGSHGEKLRIERWRHTHRAEDHDLFARILVEGSLSRKGEDALRTGGQHGSRAERGSRRSRCRSRSGSAAWASRCISCQPPTGYSDKSETWVNYRRAAESPEFCVGVRGRPDGRRHGGSEGDAR